MTAGTAVMAVAPRTPPPPGPRRTPTPRPKPRRKRKLRARPSLAARGAADLRAGTGATGTAGAMAVTAGARTMAEVAGIPDATIARRRTAATATAAGLAMTRIVIRPRSVRASTTTGAGRSTTIRPAS